MVRAGIWRRKTASPTNLQLEKSDENDAPANYNLSAWLSRFQRRIQRNFWKLSESVTL